jgi:hypothetical protein
MPSSFDPFQESPLFRRHAPRWQLETDAAEMTLDVLERGTYLPPFSAQEHQDDYAYRRSMCVPLDMCRDGVRIRVDNLWRTPPKRSVDPASRYRDLIEPLIHDADGDGTPLDAFMRRAVWNHYVTGVDIVTQVADAPAGVVIRTRRDQADHRVLPYFMQFTPLERPDWAVNGSRNFTWVRYCLGRPAAADELAVAGAASGGTDGGAGNGTGGAEADVTDFLTLTAGGYRLWRAARGPAADGGLPAAERQMQVSLLREGTHGLGIPPVVKFYFCESQKAGQGAVPLSLLTRPAVVARVAMNLKSQADAELLASVPRWFATGFQKGELPDTYGGGMLISAQDPAASLTVVQGNVEHIVEKRQWLLLYLGEILRLLKFRGGMAEITASAGSGLKLAMERTDLDNELRATAWQCERTELEMMRQAMVLATGEPIAPHQAARMLGYSVTYNRDFVLEPVGEMLDNIRTWVAQCGPVAGELTEITREMARQLANMLARDGSPQHRGMSDQIEQAPLGDKRPATRAARGRR